MSAAGKFVTVPFPLIAADFLIVYCFVLWFSPRLTWRDMQHIVVLTARRGNLNADDWKTNGVGRYG
jgi:hypothetical protein